MKKRGIEMSIQMLIVIIIALIVLVTVSVFFSTGTTTFMGKVLRLGVNATPPSADVVGNVTNWSNPFSGIT